MTESAFLWLGATMDRIGLPPKSIATPLELVDTARHVAYQGTQRNTRLARANEDE